MFGRAVAIAASVSAVCSLLAAGEAGAHCTSVRRPVRHSVNHNQYVSVQPASHRLPAWPPQRPSRIQPVVPPAKAGRGGILGDAFMVDTGVVPQLGFGALSASSATSNGSGWRVLWSNDNDSTLNTSGIGADGSPLDACGKLVGHRGDSEWGRQAQTLAGTGSGFVAVSTGAAPAYEGVWAIRLDWEGNRLDSLLISDTSNQKWPAIAFDGDSTCLVTWTLNNYDVYAARLTATGHLLDSVPFPVASSSSHDEFMPTVAFGNGVYLVSWTSQDTEMTARVKAIRVSANGAVLDTAIFLSRNDAHQFYSSVTFGDTCFLAAWTELGSSANSICAARISPSGSLMDTVPIQLSEGPEYGLNACCAFDGTSYLVAWEVDDNMPMSGGTIYGRRITADGVPLDSGFIRLRPANRACRCPSVDHDNSNFLISFTVFDSATLGQSPCCVRISPQGTVLDSGILFPLLSADAQYRPSGASDGSDFLAAWIEDRAHGRIISAARITADGRVLDPVGFLVDTSSTGKYELGTAFGDSVYLVAWSDSQGAAGTDVYCARVGLDGTVLDPNGIRVCETTQDQGHPDISFDGQNFLVAWQDYRSDARNEIHAGRVSPAGAVLDPDGFVVAAADSFDDVSPAVCFNGSDYLVVWQGHNRTTGSVYIYGALVSPGGTIERPRFHIGPGGVSLEQTPSVASGPACALVAWQDYVFYSRIYAARVQADGTVLDPDGILVDTTTSRDHLPRVTANAAGFKMLWEDHVSATAESTLYMVAQIDTAGSVAGIGEWFGLPGVGRGLDAVYGSGPDLLLLFSSWTDSYGSYRLWGRLGAVPGVSETPNAGLGTTSLPTIVRGVLMMTGDRGKTEDRASLLDVSGRKVLDLKSGANDIHGLAPGVYFVRDLEAGAEAVRKVVVTR